VTLLGLFLGGAPGSFAAHDSALPPPPITDSASERHSAPIVRKALIGKCENCGVIRSIREIERTRPAPTLQGYIASPQYLETRSYSDPIIGPLFRYTFGPGGGGAGFVGAAGSPEMQARLKQISYEVALRFDDGRYGLYEQDSVSDLRVGDKVRVIDNRAVTVREGPPFRATARANPAAIPDSPTMQ
jgi:hypothetical protein